MATIFVKTLTGETITIDVDGSETIDDVRAKIKNMTGISTERLHMIFEEAKSVEGHDGEESHIDDEGHDGRASFEGQEEVRPRPAL